MPLPESWCLMNNPVPIPSFTFTDFALALQNKNLSGIIENFPDALGSLRPSDVLTLDFVKAIDISSSLPSKVQVQLNGQKFEFPLKLKLDIPLNIDSETPLHLEIKVTSQAPGRIGFKLLSVNNQRPESFIRAPSPTTPNSEVTSSPSATALPLPQVKLSSIVENFARELNLPSESLQKILPELGKVELTFSSPEIKLNSNLPSLLPEAKAAIQNIKNQLVNFSAVDNDVSLPELVKNITNQLAKLQNIALPSETLNLAEQGQTAIRTPLGNLFPKVSAFVSGGVPLAISLQNISLNTQVSLKDLFSDKLWFDDASLAHLRSSPSLAKNSAEPIDNLLSALSLLKKSGASQSLMQNVLNKLPNPEHQDFVANLVNYVKASRHQDLSLWLGRDISEQLSSQTVDKDDISSRLNSLLTSGNREVAGWRMVEIPILHNGLFSMIKVAVKKKNDEDEAPSSSNEPKGGTRFVIDTTFTNLGKIQFDGLSFEHQHRFDLIIRTERALSDDICSHLMNLFKNSLHKLDYVGNLNINLKDNFIKPWENELNNQLSSRGIIA